MQNALVIKNRYLHISSHLQLFLEICQDQKRHNIQAVKYFTEMSQDLKYCSNQTQFLLNVNMKQFG